MRTSPCRSSPPRQAGFSLLDSFAAMTLLAVGMVAMAAFVVTTSRQGEIEKDRQVVLQGITNVVEEIRGAAPESVRATYDGRRYSVPGVQGTGPGGETISVEVDSSQPLLLVITVQGAWLTSGASHELVVRTEIFNSKG